MKYLLAIVMLFCAGSAMAWSGSTGWWTARSSSDPGGWTNVSLGYTSDEARATSPGSAIDSCGFYNFGFILPTLATIDSFDLRVEGYSNGNTAQRKRLRVALSTNGGVSGYTVADSVGMGTTSDALKYAYGTSLGNRLWGQTWTVAQVTSSNFGVLVIDSAASTLNGTFSIDHVAIRVWFTSSKATSFGRGSNEFIDTWARQNAATTNYNTDTSVTVGSSTDLGDHRFQTFKIPGLAAWKAGKTVGGAILTRKTLSNSYPSTADGESHAFQVLRPDRDSWDSATLTYNIYKTGSNWGTSGALNTSSDIYGTNYSAWDSLDYVNNDDMSIDVTELMQAVDGASTDTAGFIERMVTPGVGNGKSWVSSNALTTAIRPYLVIWEAESAAPTSARRRHEMLSSYKERIDAYCIIG